MLPWSESLPQTVVPLCGGTTQDENLFTGEPHYLLRCLPRHSYRATVPSGADGALPRGWWAGRPYPQPASPAQLLAARGAVRLTVRCRRSATRHNRRLLLLVFVGFLVLPGDPCLLLSSLGAALVIGVGITLLLFRFSAPETLPLLPRSSLLRDEPMMGWAYWSSTLHGFRQLPNLPWHCTTRLDSVRGRLVRKWVRRVQAALCGYGSLANGHTGVRLRQEWAV